MFPWTCLITTDLLDDLDSWLSLAAIPRVALFTLLGGSGTEPGW